MRTAARAICFMCILAAGLIAQNPPWVGQNGVVNSASRIPTTLAGGPIARGALFTVYGVKLGSPGHTDVTLSSAGKIIHARVLSASAAQIDALMPESAPLGETSLVVTVDGQASSRFPMEVVASNPGVFSRNGQGWGPGRIQNVPSTGVSNVVRSENSVLNPARPGQRIAIVGTGFGNSRRITLFVGGRPVSVARAIIRSGEETIEFQIPADAREGCYVPVYVLASPLRASNVVTLSVRSGSGPCRPGPLPLLNANTVGLALFTRARMKPKTENADLINDEVAVMFISKDDLPVLSPLLLLPPPGACTAYTSSFQASPPLPNTISDALVSLMGGRGLDAGSKLTHGNRRAKTAHL